MGYLHIQNLYKEQDILLFKQCYALEKIHGTSAHLMWNKNKLSTFSGGASHTAFMALFDIQKLSSHMLEAFPDKKVVIYGEAYGGKEQGMSQTYGKELKFVAFDVQIDEKWLAVPQAEAIVLSLGLEFVYYEIIDTTIDTLNAARDKPSTQAKRNGIVEDKISEGVVLRPLIELRKNNEERLIVKHKNDIFRETKSVRKLTDEQIAVLGGAQEIANEWVTEMRLSHVLDKLNMPHELSSIPMVITAMIEDIVREASTEIQDSKDARVAIGKRTSMLYRQRIMKVNA